MASSRGMSDDRGVNPYESPTELAAAWYAANYYYEASWRSAREYGGLIFRRPNGNFSVTIRKGRFDALGWQGIGKDMPSGCRPMAYWHTHLPAEAAKNLSVSEQLVLAISDLFGEYLGSGYEDLSGTDIEAAENAAKVLGYPFAIYMATATVIKRYTTGRVNQPQVWKKDPPSGMAHMFKG